MRFPTIDAYWYRKYKNQKVKNADLSNYISVLDENGNLTPSAVSCLDIAAKYSLIVCTGHVSPSEGIIILKEAKLRRISHIVLTHVDNPGICYTDGQQLQAIEMGAIIEHCFYTTFYELTPIYEIVRQIKLVSAANVILSSDFGQTTSPYFDDGLAQYAKMLVQKGISLEEITVML